MLPLPLLLDYFIALPPSPPNFTPEGPGGIVKRQPSESSSHLLLPRRKQDPCLRTRKSRKTWNLNVPADGQLEPEVVMDTSVCSADVSIDHETRDMAKVE